MYPDNQFRQELARDRYSQLLRDARTERLAALRDELAPTPVERIGGLLGRVGAVLRHRVAARGAGPAPRSVG